MESEITKKKVFNLLHKHFPEILDSLSPEEEIKDILREFCDDRRSYHFATQCVIDWLKESFDGRRVADMGGLSAEDFIDI